MSAQALRLTEAPSVLEVCTAPMGGTAPGTWLRVWPYVRGEPRRQGLGARCLRDDPTTALELQRLVQRDDSMGGSDRRSDPRAT